MDLMKRQQMLGNCWSVQTKASGSSWIWDSDVDEVYLNTDVKWKARMWRSGKDSNSRMEQMRGSWKHLPRNEKYTLAVGRTD